MANKVFNKGFNGWAQLGIFMGMWGFGLIAGSFIAAGVWSAMTGQGLMNMQQDMMNPQYAGAVKMVQLVSTLFIFFVPAGAYAFLCYKNGWLALGFRRGFTLKIAGICALVLVASLPMIDAISLFNKAIPLPQDTRTYFETIEKNYEEQVKVIGNVKTPGQYLLSLFMIALLPAIFEETLFRGGLQNMLSRWKNNALVYVVITALLIVAARFIWFKDYINPWLFFGGLLVVVLLIYRSGIFLKHLSKLTNHYLFPIIFVSILFSAVHASWYGFMPRVALGMILGLIFYYTNNLVYNVLLHFLNNAAVVTVMYFTAKNDQQVLAMAENTFPWWTAFFSVAAIFFLFRWLKHADNLEPVEEVFLIPTRDHPFDRDFNE